jgi:hypothetical protein
MAHNIRAAGRRGNRPSDVVGARSGGYGNACAPFSENPGGFKAQRAWAGAGDDGPTAAQRQGFGQLGVYQKAA